MWGSVSATRCTRPHIKLDVGNSNVFSPRGTLQCSVLRLAPCILRTWEDLNVKVDETLSYNGQWILPCPATVEFMEVRSRSAHATNPSQKLGIISSGTTHTTQDPKRRGGEEGDRRSERDAEKGKRKKANSRGGGATQSATPHQILHTNRYIDRLTDNALSRVVSPRTLSPSPEAVKPAVKRVKPRRTLPVTADHTMLLGRSAVACTLQTSAPLHSRLWIFARAWCSKTAVGS